MAISMYSIISSYSNSQSSLSFTLVRIAACVGGGGGRGRAGLFGARLQHKDLPGADN